MASMANSILQQICHPERSEGPAVAAVRERLAGLAKTESKPHKSIVTCRTPCTHQICHAEPREAIAFFMRHFYVYMLSSKSRVLLHGHHRQHPPPNLGTRERRQSRVQARLQSSPSRLL